MKTVKITVQGVSPLLVNMFPIGLDPLAAKPAVSDQPALPREQAEKKLYLHDGVVGVPGPNIYSGLIDAGRFQKSGRSKLSTRDSSLIPTGLWISDDFVPIIPADWEVDTRPVVNPSTKGRILCHRPRFDKWELSFSVDFDEGSGFNEKIVRQLVDDLGAKIGIGDFRPARKGPFGRFKVVHWDLQS